MKNLNGKIILSSSDAFRKFRELFFNGDILEKLFHDREACAEIFSHPSFIKALANDHTAIDRLLSQDNAVEYILRNERLPEKILGNEEVIAKVFNDQRFISKLLGNEEALGKIFSESRAKRIKNKYLYNGTETYTNIKQLNYLLPAFLASYPRAGSNYVQNVLTSSSGILSQSLYAPIDIDPGLILTMKTHAPSREYLHDEINSFLPVSSKPSKFIILCRDPRDTMISFYEYTRDQRNIDLDQRDFLKNTCYFYASKIDASFQRKRYIAPLSILDSYKEFVRSWLKNTPDNADYLVVYYEKLVETPGPEFRKIFDYLGLDSPLDEESLGEKVSLYSSEPNRPRAKAFGWKNLQEQYPKIIDQVNRYLADEIEFMGYSQE
ncbi:MAG: sulfotransferase domain-containing protein [bacterium]|nr:sulfotransferase domain-containing protein [bacterium]